MTTRTYAQFCGVAKALDLVGERWTLLLVRELLLGPRRFTDLQRALPGLGTSLLAARLKQLETLEVVRRDRLPPPAASAVYELTDSGLGLAPVVKALADWGSRQLDRPGAEETFRPEWLALYRAVSAQPATGVTETYQLHVGDQTVHVRVAGGRAQARTGPAPYPPELVLTTDPDTYAELGLGRTTLRDALAAGRINADREPSDPMLSRAAAVLGPTPEEPR